MPTHRFASCRTTKRSVFVVLTATFDFLTIGTWGVGHAQITKIGGYLGVLTAWLAWYATAAGVICRAPLEVAKNVRFPERWHCVRIFFEWSK
jgi:succinate-acetate transporter protein